ncbi:hypothetical protein DM02DRAFT_697682 [Periconia macrospinosa]|uniref:Uncharacterized protein n=1 Tax=Periconia macrospinosa TaxID=97972 RepID=A0A2V1DZY5_9PLEO|nr:hypothetical protein DM02DRAFT_697682 [Periconia macrospinosa]
MGDESTPPTVCGYLMGDTAQAWSAPGTSKCAVDTSAGYFGFCPMSIVDARDCPIVKACIDSHSCAVKGDGSGGCGRMGVNSYATATCTAPYDGFCYTNLLVAAPSATYSFVGCDTRYRQDTFTIAANVIPSSTPPPSPSPPISPSSILPPSSSSSSSSFPTPTSPNFASQHPASEAHKGPIVAGVISGLGIVAITGLVFYYLKRRTRVAGVAETTHHHHHTQPIWVGGQKFRIMKWKGPGAKEGEAEGEGREA